MAKCENCGKTLKGWQSTLGGTCSDCFSRDVSVNVSSVDVPILSANNQIASDGSTSAATAFTSLAWIIVALTFVCTLIATFVTAADGDPVSAIMVFIGGCFSAVLLGLLTEIFTNIAKLDNNSR